MKILMMALVVAVGATVGHGEDGLARLDAGFFVGVNFWGSKAGIHMWRAQDWDAAEIEKDLDAMKANGVEVLRVFPTWPDFQTQKRDIGQYGRRLETLSPDKELPLHDPLWLDPGALERFRFFCDECRKRDLKLIVSLVTGWMSGRLFIPDFLYNRNPITDPEAIMWEGRFVRGFVRRMKDHPAIAAWDLGNECDCMGRIESKAQAWNWLHAISSAIRVEDPSRLVISGMHGMTSNAYGPQWSGYNAWTLQMQGELLDVLTPHPYPAPWRVDANRGPFNGFRNALHQVSQCLFYSGVSGKPAFPEEVGSFGPTLTPDRIAAKGLRQQMFASWQFGTPGFLWWCAFRQMNLSYPPFCNNAMERELGLVREDAARTPLPQAETMRVFKAFKDSLPFKALPPRRCDAVVLVSELMEFYHQTYGALMLSAQAGFDIAVVGAESRELPEAKLYIVPSGEGGWNFFSNYAWDRVLAKVEQGATVLVTRGYSCGYSTWEEVTGLEQQVWRENRRIDFTLDGKPLTMNEIFFAKQAPVACDVLVKDTTGNVVISRKTRGKGKVIVCNLPLEKESVASTPNVFEGDFSNELWRIYALAAREAGITRLVTREDPRLVVTEHPRTDGSALVCVLNTREEDVKAPLRVTGKVGRIWNGTYENGVLSLRGNDGCVFEVEPAK